MEDVQLEQLLRLVFVLQFVLAVFGSVLSLPHLFILTRKSMRTSSTNSILTGIALCDLLVVLEIIHQRVHSYWLTPFGDPCVNDQNYWYQMSLIISDVVRESSERSSYWLGVLLALIRVLIMKIPGNSTILAEPSFGYTLSLLIVLSNFALTGYAQSEWKLIPGNELWRPGESCTGFPENYSEPMFYRVLTTPDADKMVDAYVFSNGLSRITVSILHPCMALVLVMEIKKSRCKIGNLDKKLVAERQKSEKLILAVTVSFILASAPGGALEIIQLFFIPEPFSIWEGLIGYGSILMSKSMRTSSTNSLLIGIAISDIVVLAQIIFERSRYFFLTPIDDDCVLSTTYFYEMASYIFDIFKDTCERCTFIFGVFLALIRLIVLKFPQENFYNFCRPITGYLIVINCLSINFLITLYNYLKWKILFAGYWEPPEECTGFPKNHTEKIYYRVVKSDEELSNFLNNYMFVNGFSRIILAVVYPILAFLLFWQIYRSAKFAARSLSDKEANERTRTAYMILVMIIGYVISSAPTGITNFIQYFVDPEPYPMLDILVSSSYVVVSILFCWNAMAQSIINYSMSNVYRKTAKSVFCCVREQGQSNRMFAKSSTSTQLHY